MGITKLILILILISGCAKDEEEFNCNVSLPAQLETININDDITSTPELIELFNSAQEVINYTSGSFCEDTYYFNQYNPSVGKFCYYVTVDVTCSTNLIESIYGRGGE